jgi:hypothetical protein
MKRAISQSGVMKPNLGQLCHWQVKFDNPKGLTIRKKEIEMFSNDSRSIKIAYTRKEYE